MTDSDILKRLRRFAAEPYGIKRRDVTDRFDSKPRPRARELFAELIAAELVLANPGDRYSRYFRTAEAAAAWVAAGKKDPEKARGRRSCGRGKALTVVKAAVPGYVWRDKKAADPAKVIGLDMAPTRCWSPDRDYRHQVLPGEAPSVVDAGACRAWAAVVATGIATASA